ncbi:MAG: hypothetical protein ABI647_11150 [Gemmatimonadota bacterium]
MIRRHPGRTAWTCILLSGCGAARTGPDAVQFRDSAGIEIVASAAPNQPGPFTIDSLPEIDIGRDTADPRQLFRSSYLSAHVLSDGRIVAAGWGTQELRVFDSTGKSLETIGRIGAGPGEFEGFGWVFVGSGDTLYTFEPFNRRAQVFAPDGRFLRFRTVTSSRIGGFPWGKGVLADGSVLFTSTPPTGKPRAPGLVRPPTNLLRYRPDGGDVDSLGTAPGKEGAFALLGKMELWYERPFGRTTLVAVTGTKIYVAPTDRFEIAVHDSSGRLLRLIRRAIAPQRVPAAEADSMLADYINGLGAEYREAGRRALSSIAGPATKPAFQNLVVGSDGSIWVEHYNEPVHGPTVASVFDSTGALRGEVTLPPGLGLLQVGPGFVLGTWQDADGAAHIRRHRLRGRI